MWSDIRYAARILVKSPLFALTAIAALALGIGANTAIFSVFNGLMLHPAGVSEPDRVVVGRVKYDKLNLKSIPVSAPDFADMRADIRADTRADIRGGGHVFSAAAAMVEADYNYTGGDWPERLQGAQITWQWFNVFGARPQLGRVFRPEEDQPKANQEVVLAYSAWKRVFGGDATIVDKTIQLNQQSYRVVGVMGPEFRWPSQADLWTPLGLPPDEYSEQNRYNEGLFVAARMKPGVPFAEADAFVKLAARRLIEEHDPEHGYARDSGWGMFLVPLTEFVFGDVKTPVLILLGAVTFVLLIACANIAGLMLVRSSARSREIAVRAALGAGRWRLIRQTLAESLVLAAAGTLAGLAVAYGGVRLLLDLAPESLATGVAISLDRYVLLFTAGIGVLAGVLFGLAPAWQVASIDRYESLKEGGRAGTAGRRRQRVRSLLVAGELALALVLLVGAGLFLKSLSRIEQVDTGFEPRGVMTAALALPETQYGDEDKRATFYRTVLERLSAVPGVRAAGAGAPVPFSGGTASASFGIEGRPEGPGDPGPHGNVRFVTPGYFTALGIPLREGRYFTDQDRKGTEPVVMIDENLARQYWPNQDPVGRRMRRGTRAPWAAIVGVVGHVKHSELVGDSDKGVYYYPIFQQPVSQTFFVVKTSGDPLGLSNAIREAVRSVDRSQPVHDLVSMEQRISSSLGPRRFAVQLLGLFAAIALLMAALGLYGVIAYTVTQRTQEIGIRMALGAQRQQVMGLVLGQALRLSAAGVLAGLVVASVLARLVSSQLFEVSAFDPVTFAIMALGLMAVALLASYGPARRATRVDPMVALRY
ncbi:MAG TPA: ABC transporter permease, partial [Gemmataceae bacterium]|nr:ABC transporter permease [Gemmataceae bacterium]